MLKDVFGFREHQKKATYGISYKLPLTRNKNDAILRNAVALADAKIKYIHILLCVPYYSPSTPQ